MSLFLRRALGVALLRTSIGALWLSFGSSWFATGVYAQETQLRDAETTARRELPEVAAANDLIAAMLVNFPAYVRWPGQQTEEVFRFGIVGGDRELEQALWSSVERRRILGRRVDVVRILRSNQLPACNLVYVASEGAWRELIGERSVFSGQLIVAAEEVGERAPGVQLWFHLLDGRLRFAVDLEAARSAGIGFDARLLQLAVETRGVPLPR
jgi:hypothetical protein